MAKSSATRLAEAVSYIGAVDAQVASELRQILNSRSEVVRRQISDQISLSGRTPWFGDSGNNNSETQRDALRALLLCQRVYFSSLWSERLGEVPHPGNNQIWPQVTLNHWRFKPEIELRSGIRMFARMQIVSKPMLARAAAVRSHNPDTWYTTGRGSANPPVGNSCYDQVSHWLLSAGYVSLRWMAKHRPNGFIYDSFGPGREWITRAAAVPATPFQIEPGMIVRMYTARRPGGHFMISAGGGFGWGYNNSPKVASAEEGLVPNGHARCLIHRQFADYREAADRVDQNNLGGILVLLDPDRLPSPC